MLAELVTAVFFVWLAVEAVYHENAFELLAAAIVASGIAARFIYFTVRPWIEVDRSTEQRRDAREADDVWDRLHSRCGIC